MANEKKMTKRDYFNQILAIDEVANNDALKGFVEHELELLARKNTSDSGKKTAVQVANDGIKAEILECLKAEPDRMFTITEMQKNFPCCAELSNQRVSALVRQMLDISVKKIVDKRKSYFQYLGE